jgi:hypothetical protein
MRTLLNWSQSLASQQMIDGPSMGPTTTASADMTTDNMVA